MPKAEVAIPSQIEVVDEHSQKWTVTPQDTVWEECLREYQKGDGSMPPLIPLAKIKDHMGWGWWTVFKNQEEFLANLGIPLPSHETLPIFEDLLPQQLGDLLQKFGGYVTYLEPIIGGMTGRQIALKDGLAAAILVESAKLDDGKKTEKAKEAQIVAGSETLRRTKRMLIEQEALLATAKGIRDAYKQAYDTISRQISLKALEVELATSRHA